MTLTSVTKGRVLGERMRSGHSVIRTDLVDVQHVQHVQHGRRRLVRACEVFSCGVCRERGGRARASYMRLGRALLLMSLAASALPWVAPSLASAAEPVLRVRGKAEVDLAAGWLDGHLIVSGAARDETGRPLAGAVLALVGRGATGTTVELAGGTPCSPLAEADKVPQGTPEERSLRTDRAGRFCVDF